MDDEYDDMDKAGCSALLFGLVLGSLIAFVVTAQCVPGTPAAQVDAVKHGAGRWVVDDEGDVKFEWTTTKEE